MPDPKREIRNIGQPGKTYRVDAAKFAAMEAAVLAALADHPPGMTVADLIETVRPTLPQNLFPGGDTAGWWVKSVQLHLEAEGTLTRTKTSPLRLHLATP